MDFHTEALVVGGGATGAGIARDLVMRGVETIMVEKGDLAAGATGRCHGLLHSGGRYAVKDPESAVECILENKIIKEIAPKAVEDTGGLFVALPEDDEAYMDRFVSACFRIGIETVNLTLSQARRMEPNLSEEASVIIRVPDAAVDPFMLTVMNARDAEIRGAKIMRYCELVGIVVERGRVSAALVRDNLSGETHRIRTRYIINATGGWAAKVARMGGAMINMTLSKGSLLVFNRRINNCVINRLRPPGDGDIIVPNEPTSIIGTTSITVKDPEDFRVTDGEVEMMMREAGLMLPESAEARVIRAYAGIRPLAAPETGSGRDASRTFTIIDHKTKNDVAGFLSIIGGKLTTYRLMAEKITDIIADDLGISIPCKTASTPILEPGNERHYSLGDRFGSIEIVQEDKPSRVEEIVCECELVTKREIVSVVKDTGTKDLNDIRVRTRVGMGSCQGGFCTYRLLGILHELDMVPDYEANEILIDFLEGRWKGIRPILWGDQLREEQLIEGIYMGIFALDKVAMRSGAKKGRSK
ncbi:MAG: anaerobic glycerol-3-phosphate dehydrogenase subunit A [Deltaproteobacteria bacterium]|nr:anaerobic glycerol-3-phosphate dehydrogenase subunit A [Candidatus Zymogenaceae bacterium]